MDTLSIIEAVFSCLPDDIKSNRFLLDTFANIKHKINEKSFIPSSILVSSEVFEKITDNEFLAKTAVSSVDGEVLKLPLIISGVSYTFNIKIQKNNRLFIDVDFRCNGEHFMTSYRELDENILVSNEKVDAKGKYHVEVYVYDKDLKSFYPCDDDKIKDLVFALRFNIPLKYAGYIRINSERFMKPDGLDTGIPEDEMYALSLPVSLDNVKSYTNALLSSLIKTAKNYEEKVCYKNRKDNLMRVLDALISKVGLGDVVMTNGLCQLLFCIPLFPSELIEKAIIIKVVGDRFVLYKISNVVLGEDIRVEFEEISSDKVRELYNKSTLNQDVDGLKEYLGIPRT